MTLNSGLWGGEGKLPVTFTGLTVKLISEMAGHWHAYKCMPDSCSHHVCVSTHRVHLPCCVATWAKSIHPAASTYTAYMKNQSLPLYLSAAFTEVICLISDCKFLLRFGRPEPLDVSTRSGCSPVSMLGGKKTSYCFDASLMAECPQNKVIESWNLGLGWKQP